MVTKNPTHICWLCGKDVDLRACKIDEHGSAVHESCYMVKLALLAGSAQSIQTTRIQN